MHSVPSEFQYHPFNELMSTTAHPDVLANTQRVLGYDGSALLHSARTLYEKHCLENKPGTGKKRIPKIVHQIWIGGSCPEVFKKYLKSWREKHPEWTYVLWDDESIASLFPLYNQKYYDETVGLGAKSDLLRWEIVYRYGGVYADVDFECLRSLDDLIHLDFFTAFQPYDAYFVQLGAAIFAAVPGHPVLKHCIETIEDDWHHKGAPKKTGPVHFSKSFMAVAGKDASRDVAFPAPYFYPLGSTEQKLCYDRWISSGAFAVHHWAKSWMPRHHRRVEFRSFDNVASSSVWNE